MRFWGLILVAAGSMPAAFMLGAVPSNDAGLTVTASSLEIQDRYGKPLRTVLSDQELVSQPVALEQISPWLLLATVATEDQRFYQHGGVDLRAIARAVGQNIRAGHIVSGASTLTQQLARSITPRPRSFVGKAKEALGAWKLERELSKEEILEAYMNRAPYGNQCQGAEAASRLYFGVPARDLSLAQAAALAAIPKSPAKYDPYRDRSAAEKRQQWVLDTLAQGGWIDAETLRLAQAERLDWQPKRREFSAPHFTQALRALQPDRVGLLHSTLDAALQVDLEPLLRSHLASLKGHGVGNGAILVLDNRNGDVLAWLGSRDFYDEGSQGQVDGVSALRQPGSALKPFLYALAFENGSKPFSFIEDEAYSAKDGYTPQNYDRSFHGHVSLRQALACSYNIPAVKLLEALGVARFHRRLIELGMRSLSADSGHYGLGLALGNGEVTLAELANAYATLARGGQSLPLRLDRDEALPRPRQVMNLEASFLVTQILSDNAARSPAFGLNSPLQLPFPLAAKTGTTKDYRDNWCVGYTPAWTVAVWVGNFDGKPMRRISGITGAAPLMHDVALRVQRDRPGGAFQPPRGVIQVELCADSGQLPEPGCQRLRQDWAARWALPQERCQLHGRETVKSGPAKLAGRRPVIKAPRPGGLYAIDPGLDRGAQVLELQALGEPQGLHWKVDSQAIPWDAEGRSWWPLQKGYHQAQAAYWDGQRSRTSAVSHFRVIQ